MPQATAPGFHVDAIGTNSSDQPKCVKLSAISATRWTPTNTAASAPRCRWRSRSHAGGAVLPRVRVERRRPQSTARASRAHATMPLALDTYHAVLGSMASAIVASGSWTGGDRGIDARGAGSIPPVGVARFRGVGSVGTERLGYLRESVSEHGGGFGGNGDVSDLATRARGLAVVVQV